MDLECGDIIYVSATVERTVNLNCVSSSHGRGIGELTIAEARTLASALQTAADEAEAYRAPDIYPNRRRS